ncbi:MAG: peptidylprolyl isomerase, partial [Bacteroidota bacterium]
PAPSTPAPPADGATLDPVATRGTYSSTYQTEAACSERSADAVMNQMEVGTIMGPYVEGNAYKLAKLIDRKVMADSATVRLIERRAVTADQVTEANNLIDSLQTVLERSPGKWADLAEEFSQNPFSNSEGGRLTGVKPGEQVRGVDNIIFRTGDVGKVYKVTTPGSIFLVQVSNRSRSTSTRAKVAYITEPIVPSSETEDAVLAEAQSFLAGKENIGSLKAAAEAAGMEVKTTAPLLQSNYILDDLGSGQQVRDMMCFAYGADKGDVSGIAYTFTDPQLFYENYYVLVGVEDVVPAGLTPVAAIREVLTPTVRNQKKGDVVSSAVAGKDLVAIAAQYDVEIDTVSSNPTLASLPSIGREPKVVAAAASLATGSQSGAIVGNDGVFFLVPLNDASGATSGNLPGARLQLNLAARQQVIGSLLPALRTTAD